MCNNQRRGVLQVRTEHSSWESEGDSPLHTNERVCSETVVMCGPENTTENDHKRSWILFAESFHDEFHDESVARTDGDVDENVSTTRPLTHRGPHNERARGKCGHEGRCESGARVQRPPGSAKNKGRGDSTGFR